MMCTKINSQPESVAMNTGTMRTVLFVQLV